MGCGCCNFSLLLSDLMWVNRTWQTLGGRGSRAGRAGSRAGTEPSRAGFCSSRHYRAEPSSARTYTEPDRAEPSRARLGSFPPLPVGEETSPSPSPNRGIPRGESGIGSPLPSLPPVHHLPRESESSRLFSPLRHRWIWASAAGG